MDPEGGQGRPNEADKDALAMSNRKARRRLRVMAGLLAASSLVAAVAIHRVISSSRMAHQSQQELSLQLQRFEDERSLAQQASRIPLTAPNQLNPSTEGISLEEQGQTVVRQSAQYPGQVQALVEALQLGYALKAQLLAANAQSNRLTMHNYPAYSPMLALRMTTSSLMQQPDEPPHNHGNSQAETPGGVEAGTLLANGAALFNLVEHPFINELFVAWRPNGQGVVTYSKSKNRIYLRSFDGVEQARFEGEFHGFTANGQGVLTLTKRNDVGPDAQNGLSPEGVPPEGVPPEGVPPEASDAQIRLWSLDGGEKASFEGRFQGFTPDGQGLLIFTKGDDTLRLWGFDGKERARFKGEFKQFTPDGQGLMTMPTSDYRMRLWSLDGLERASFEGRLRGFSPDGQGVVTDSYLLSSSRLGRWWSPVGIQASQLWNLDGTKQAVVKGYFRDFTPDGQGLITYVGSLEKGRWQTLMDNLRSHLKHRNAAFASMMRVDYAGTTHLWSLDGERRASVAGDLVSFTPDGQGLVTNYTGDGSSYAYLWSLDGDRQASFEGSFAGFTPDGQGLVTDGWVNGQSSARLWNLNGEEQASFAGSFRGFIPNNQGLMTDSGNDTTLLWNFQGDLLAEVLGVVRSKTDVLAGATGFSEDGRFLLTAPADLNQPLTYRIWPMDNGLDDLLARGCKLLSNHFRANPSQREELGICLDQPL